MRQFYHILKKECRQYFVSPIAYIVISIFLTVTGWFFFSTFFIYDQADMRNFFTLLPLVFSFVIPAVTMRLFSEEFYSGAYEVLLTMPVTRGDVILGKFAAGVMMTAALLLPTLSYPVTISFLGNLDWGPVIGGYTGALLLGAAFSAVGIFASSLTRNQIIAFILGAAVCFTLTLLDKLLFFFPEAVLDTAAYLGADTHFANISRGIIDSRDIIYFFTVIFAALYATYLSLLRKE